MKFKIFRENTPHFYIKGESKEIRRSPYTHYCLVDNDPEFYGEGNFCGYYATSGFIDGHVLAETKISWVEGEENITFYRTIILDCDYIRDIADSYRCPLEFTADSLEEARQVFKNIVTKDLFDRLNP